MEIHMNPLRSRFHEFMIYRCLSEKTIQSYMAAVKGLAAYYCRSPELITTEEIIRYVNHLSNEEGKTFSTCNVAISAFKCFYNQFLRDSSIRFNVPPRRGPKKLPAVLSREEVKRLIEAAHSPLESIILKTAYDTGMRSDELRHLKLEHIDSRRMVIQVICGKGKKDRLVPLSEVLLNNLRSYYSVYKPTSYLFYRFEKDKPVSKDIISLAYRRAKKRAGINKPGGIHTLRHSFATHLVEDGCDISTVQELLGHKDISTTKIYLHLSNRMIQKVKSLLDTLLRSDSPDVDPFQSGGNHEEN